MTFRPGDVNLADANQLLEVGLPPHDYLAVLRSEAPVHWNPAPESPGPLGTNTGIGLLQGFWVLSKWEDVAMASKDATRFSSWLGGPIIFDEDPNVPPGPIPYVESQRMGMMGKDHPEHTAYRKLVSSAFTPKNIAAMEPIIREHAARIIDRVRDAQDGEFIETVAAELPMMTLCELLGVPQKDWAQLFQLGNRSAQLEDPTIDVGANIIEMFEFCQRLVEEKRANPDNSMLSRYATEEVDGEKLSDFEINMFFMTLSIAGHETTRNTTAHVVRMLSENPDQRKLLLEDLHGRLPNAIEETLRISPPVVQFRRTATCDIELRGTTIREGDKVYLSYASANRDEDIFSDPNRFDILRPEASKHLSFGAGPHFCMGGALARLQLRILLEELLTARPDVHVNGDIEQLRSVWFNGINTMPVSFEAAGVAQ